jgi:hypothetical protein
MSRQHLLHTPLNVLQQQQPVFDTYTNILGVTHRSASILPPPPLPIIGVCVCCVYLRIINL